MLNSFYLARKQPGIKYIFVINSKMRFVIQRVSSATIRVPSKNISRSIGKGLVVFVGINKDDRERYTFIVKNFGEKINQIKFFSDEEGRIVYSNYDISGEIAIIPNFTLYGRHDKGRKIDFSQSESAQVAKEIYDYLIENISKTTKKFITGEFGQYMEIEQNLIGPVTTIRDL